ncbi:MAG TPA: prenyltransferase/squalene oxidase repeat-containing protein [Chloroflexota bacterium]|nr:prenyltransferase/squalene oxidase repeat-containing protein [Chloroflexota bacterium]
MVHLERAAAFVGRHGTDVERARLASLLTGRAPSETIVDALFAGQRPDGGWSPFWASDYSSRDATCYRLAQADQLGLNSAEPVQRAVRFLLARQASDGSWQEDSSVRDAAPPWAQPGDPAARLYLTANCGYWLAILESETEAAGRAARFLAGHLGDDGSLPTFPHSHWLAAGLWYRTGETAAAEAVLGHLTRCLSRLAASNLGWLVVTLQGVGLPAGHPLLRQATDRLAAEQQPDGRWVSEDGPERDVHATLEALRAIRGGMTTSVPDIDPSI